MSVSGECVKCGTYRKSLHHDHIVPRFLGGTDDPDNIQMLCANCHEDKTRVDLTGKRGRPLSAANLAAARRNIKIARSHPNFLAVLHKPHEPDCSHCVEARKPENAKLWSQKVLAARWDKPR